MLKYDKYILLKKEKSPFLVKNMYLRTRKYYSATGISAPSHSKNMIKTFKISTFVVAMAALLCSCLKGNDSETVTYNYSNATVTSFSFSNNSNVCSNLSGYKFVIDNAGVTDTSYIHWLDDLWQVNEWSMQPGIIFNPDSLPSGSEPDSITVSMSYSSPSQVLFYQYNDYLELANVVNFADTTEISFDDYFVTRLEITANDEHTNKSYFIKVNVHKQFGDTVVWQYFADEVFDTESVVDQYADTIGNDIFWYTELQDGSQQVRTSKLDGNITEWSEAEVLSADIKLHSLLTINDTLYAISKNGGLLQSTDGKNFNERSTAFTFYNLLGCQPEVELNGKVYNSASIVAIVKEGDEYHFARTFDGTTWEKAALNGGTSSLLPSNFPIDGYTMPISVDAQPKAGNVTSRIYLVGGVDQQGNLCSSTWSCDGNVWAEFTQNNLPPMQKASVVTYTRDIDYPGTLWILQPGLMADGEVSNELWFSENSGVTWKVLEKEYPEMADTEFINPIACGSAFFSTKNYKIYFLGGIDAEGKQKSSIYGGCYNELNFRKIR